MYLSITHWQCHKQIAPHPSEPLPTNHMPATITFCNLPQINNQQEAYILLRLLTVICTQLLCTIFSYKQIFKKLHFGQAWHTPNNKLCYSLITLHPYLYSPFWLSAIYVVWILMQFTIFNIHINTHSNASRMYTMLIF